MPVTRDYSFYDYVTFGNAASVEHVAFQVRQGTDSTNNKFKTNARGNGEFPVNESFDIKRVMLFPDADMTQAELLDWMYNGYVQINVSDQIVFQATIRECVALNHFGGIIGADATSVPPAYGVQNDGYMLKMPISLKGGNSFQVFIGQGTALAGNVNVKVVLVGDYTTPN